MTKKSKAINQSDIDEILNLINSKIDYNLGIKLNAILQVMKGKSPRKICEYYNCSFRIIYIWFDNYMKFGLEGLFDDHRSGRPSQLSSDELEKIRIMILEESPVDKGYNTGTWTGPILTDYISKEFGVFYKKAEIYVILKKLGLSYQKGKGYSKEADPEKRKEFLETLQK